MSLIQTPWTSQPQQAVGIDWSNHLARTITYCLPLNGDNRELVTGAKLTLTNGSYGVDSKGKSLRGSGTNSCASVPLNLSAYNKLTVSFWLYWDTFANDDKFAFELTSDTNTNVGGFNVNPNSSAGTGFLIYTLMSSGFGRGRVYTRPSAGAWHHIFYTMDRTVPASSGVFCNLWIDGVLQTPTEIGFASAGANNFANSTLYLFSRNNASLFGAGRMQNLVFRGGYLGTGLEAREEYRNPWQIFKPLPRRIFTPVATGSGTTAVTADHNASYTITGSVAADASAAYAIRAAVTADAAASYTLRAAAQADQSAAYAIRAAVASDQAASYAIRAAVTSDQAASYAIRVAVTANATASYAIRAAAQADQAAAYAIRSAVASDLASSYAIQTAGTVTTGLDAAYTVRGSVAGDISVGYQIAAAVQAEVTAAYAVRAAVQKDLSAGYDIDAGVSSVAATLSAAYWIDGEAVILTPDAKFIAIGAARNKTVTAAARRYQIATRSS